MAQKEIKCSSCGHINPAGTQLCQSCGKLINENYDKKKIKDVMRYDGSAVRSKVRSQTLYDKVWNFFTSVRNGVIIIALIAIAAAIGTIFPQEYFIPVGADPAEHYQEHYGTLGYLYYQLGLHNLYSSWWFLILNGLLALSIIAASIDRGVPLFKTLYKQHVKKHDSFFKRQRLYSIQETTIEDEKVNSIVSKLKKMRYKVRTDGDNYLFEKGRFSRWGPYINHSGLIIILFGSMLRFFPGFYIDEIIYVSEGETVAIPTTNNEYYIENHRFIVKNYDQEENEVFSNTLMNEVVTENFQTDVTIYRNLNQNVVGSRPDLEFVDDYSIRVNHPYRFNGYEIFQSSFDSSQLKSMTFFLEDADGEQVGEPFVVDLRTPDEVYNITDDIVIDMRAYSPDFLEIADNGTLVSQTPVPRNPAFVFEVNEQGEDSERSFIRIMGSTPITDNNEYSIRFLEAEEQVASVLTLKKDLTMPFFAVGFVIFLFGLFIGSYINHRRIWIKNDGTFKLAAHTNKNYFGLKKELNKVLESENLEQVEDKFVIEQTVKDKER